MPEGLTLRELAVFLAIAGLLVPLAQRLRVGQVLAFLAAGLLFGPHALGRVGEQVPWVLAISLSDTEAVHVLAELGVVFLLFMIGLELSLARLWALRRLVFGLGGLQIVVSALLIGLVAAWFGNSASVAVILGACLALSSTAIVIPLLTAGHQFGTPRGRGVFAVLLAQDLAVVPILFMVGAMAVRDGDGVATALLLSIAEAVLAVVMILWVGRLVLRRLFAFAARRGSPEVLLAVTLLVILGTASLTHAAGLSAALGAFLVGLLLGETEYRHEIEATIEPFKGLLLGIFFLSVGMGIDLQEVAAEPFWIPVSVLGLLLLKGALVVVLARAFGYRWPAAAEMALMLAASGEFAFVVVSLALDGELLPEATAQFMLIVVSLSMFLIPALAALGRRLGRDVEQGVEPVAGPAEDGHVVVAGFGRTGSLLAELLQAQAIPVVVLESDPERVAQGQQQGLSVFLGDASRAALLRQVGAEQAAALVVTMDAPDAAARVVSAAQELAPHVPVIARAEDHAHAVALKEVGADHAVPEVFESGLQLGEVMLVEVGLPVDAARRVIDERREQPYTPDAH